MARALQRVVLRRPVELTGVKRTFLQLTTMSVVDLGCVKTQKSQNRRELFFSDQAKANTLKNSRRYNCDSEKRSFYRRRAPLRFYTAKTQSGSPAPNFSGTHKNSSTDVVRSRPRPRA